MLLVFEALGLVVASEVDALPADRDSHGRKIAAFEETL